LQDFLLARSYLVSLHESKRAQGPGQAEDLCNLAVCADIHLIDPSKGKDNEVEEIPPAAKVGILCEEETLRSKGEDYWFSACATERGALGSITEGNGVGGQQT